MRREDFQFFAALFQGACGLSLTPSRSELILRRLKPVAERHGFADLPALVRELKRGNEPLASAVIEAMTIQDTSFFRDRAAFEAFRDCVLPLLWRARLPKRRLSIWSAACATGQEPYSLAMILAGLPQFAGWEIEILATDVSPEAIGRAKEGLYNPLEVQRGLPVGLLGEHFRQSGGEWRIADSIRKRVQFRVFNLLDRFSDIGPFDVIFCRNVLMYFDSATKGDILGRLSDALVDDGYLVLGAAETVLGSSNSFAADGPARGIRAKANGAQNSALPRPDEQ